MRSKDKIFKKGDYVKVDATHGIFYGVVTNADSVACFVKTVEGRKYAFSPKEVSIIPEEEFLVHALER